MRFLMPPSIALLTLASVSLAYAEDHPAVSENASHEHTDHDTDDHHEHESTIEEMLLGAWSFFDDGDQDSNGYIEKNEFFEHPVYMEMEWGRREITFVFWMVDDNKDGRVSLQEWFNNELGQFQIADTNNDGSIDEDEAAKVSLIEHGLFDDLWGGG